MEVAAQTSAIIMLVGALIMGYGFVVDWFWNRREVHHWKCLLGGSGLLAAGVLGLWIFVLIPSIL